MSRYFTRGGHFLGDDWPSIDEPLLADITVPDHRPVDTGLVDQRGDPIWRGPEPVGFHHPKERG